MPDADVHFYFDPVCQFAWMTSKWVRKVVAARDYRVEWRLISLRLVNEHVDYDAQFPPDYEAYHDAGLRMLRVAARTRADWPLLGDSGLLRRPHLRPAAVEGLRSGLDGRPQVTAILAHAGLPEVFVESLDDGSWDAETTCDDRKGRGTPILHVDHPAASRSSDRSSAA